MSPSSKRGELPKLARDLKQCQSCYASETAERPLRACSGCKRCYYCTRECQTKDWKLHKKMCMIMSQRHEHYEDPEKQSEIKAAFGLNAEEGEIKTKRWVQFYRPLLLASLKHALKLQTDEPLNDHCLYLDLVPNFTADNVPRTDDDLINAFKAHNISVRSIKEFITESPHFKPMFDSLVERERNLTVTPGQEHIICLAAVVVSIPAFNTIRFVPFGVAGPKECMAPYNLSWKHDLERGIDKAAPCGCRVCLQF